MLRGPGRHVAGDVWIGYGAGGMECWTFRLLVGDHVHDRDAIPWAKLLPRDGHIGWLHVDVKHKALTVDPRAGDDWRIQGQEKSLTGAELIRRRYRRYARNPNWDHDHCEFCFDRFAVADPPEASPIGYATPDDYRWICETCFADFRGRFAWKVIADEVGPR